MESILDNNVYDHVIFACIDHQMRRVEGLRWRRCKFQASTSPSSRLPLLLMHRFPHHLYLAHLTALTPPTPLDYYFYEFEIRGVIATDLHSSKRLNFSTETPIKTRIKKIQQKYETYKKDLARILNQKNEYLDENPDADVKDHFDRICWNLTRAERDVFTEEDMRKELRKKWKQQYDKNLAKAKETHDLYIKKYQKILQEFRDFNSSVTSQKPDTMDSDLLGSIPDSSEWHILNIPSLLETVFSFLSLREMFHCLTVSREWYFFLLNQQPVRISTNHSLGKAPFYRFLKSFRHFELLEFRMNQASAGLLQKARILLSKATVRQLVMPNVEIMRMKDADINKFVQEVQKQQLRMLTWSSSILPLGPTQHDTLTTLNLLCAMTSEAANRWIEYISHLTSLRELNAPPFIHNLSAEDCVKLFHAMPHTITHIVLPSTIQPESVNALRTMLRHCPLEELKVFKHGQSSLSIRAHPQPLGAQIKVATLVPTVEHIFDEMTTIALSRTLKRLMIKFDKIHGLLDLSSISHLQLENLDIDPGRYSSQINLQKIHTKMLFLRNCPTNSDLWISALDTDVCERIILSNTPLTASVPVGPNSRFVRFMTQNRKELESSNTLKALTETINNAAANQDFILALSYNEYYGHETFLSTNFDPRNTRTQAFQFCTAGSMHTLYYLVQNPEKVFIGPIPLDHYMKDTHFHVCVKCGIDTWGSSSLCAPCNGYSFRNNRRNLYNAPSATMTEAEQKKAYEKVLATIQADARRTAALIGEHVYSHEESTTNGDTVESAPSSTTTAEDVADVELVSSNKSSTQSQALAVDIESDDGIEVVSASALNDENGAGVRSRKRKRDGADSSVSEVKKHKTDEE